MQVIAAVAMQVVATSAPPRSSLLPEVWRVRAEDVCGGRAQSCQGCNKVVVCALLDGVHFSPVATVPCSRAAPFCEAGHCVATMSADNPCDITPRPSTTFTVSCGTETS